MEERRGTRDWEDDLEIEAAYVDLGGDPDLTEDLR